MADETVEFVDKVGGLGGGDETATLLKAGDLIGVVGGRARRERIGRGWEPENEGGDEQEDGQELLESRHAGRIRSTGCI